MDTSLVLKMEYDSGKVHTNEEIERCFSKSEVIHSLTSSFSKAGLYPIWRVIALSEIPYTGRLLFTQNLVEYIEKTYSTIEGFSITGKSDDILPCYNAMLIEAFSKLGYGDRISVRSGVEWIKKYQIFERNGKVVWKGRGISKYGGCMKTVPCYIGIVKTLKTLIYYSENVQDDMITPIIGKGVEYVLQHNLYQRFSNKEPITKHILDIAYPPSYQVNILELLEIIYKTKKMYNPGVEQAVNNVISRKTKDNHWKINHVYKAEGYVSFDRRGVKGEWVTYLLDKYLGNIHGIDKI